jgi:hypothetical protein
LWKLKPVSLPLVGITRAARVDGTTALDGADLKAHEKIRQCLSLKSGALTDIPARAQWAMPIFFLGPKDGATGHRRWAATSLNEGCWVEAISESEARIIVQQASVKMVDFVPGEPILVSPWLDPNLTDCALAKPPIQVPEGFIVTVTGRTIS